MNYLHHNSFMSRLRTLGGICNLLVACNPVPHGIGKYLVPPTRHYPHSPHKGVFLHRIFDPQGQALIEPVQCPCLAHAVEIHQGPPRRGRSPRGRVQARLLADSDFEVFLARLPPNDIAGTRADGGFYGKRGNICPLSSGPWKSLMGVYRVQFLPNAPEG